MTKKKVATRPKKPLTLAELEAVVANHDQSLLYLAPLLTANYRWLRELDEAVTRLEVVTGLRSPKKKRRKR